MLWLLLALFTKHLIFDFLYQPPYQWMNKGTYGHPGGIAHAGQHLLATAVVLSMWSGFTLSVLSICLGEFIIHYHMDWFKMWYNNKKGWACNTHPEFWHLTGIDQFIHSITYLGIAALV